MQTHTRSHHVGALVAALAIGFCGLFIASSSSASATGLGYWTAQGDGSVQAIGDAPFLGSMGGHHLTQLIAGMAATPTREGYWLVARDGGIFSFGDAHFYGSTGSMVLRAPMNGITTSPTGRGYRTVARD